MAAPSDRFDKTLRAADEVRRRCPLVPEVGVILGSGLGAFGDTLAGRVAIPYAELPGWPTGNVVGHAGRISLGRAGDVPVAALQGRAHLYEGHDVADAAFAVRVLFHLGVRRLVVTNAAGAVNTA